MVDYQTWTSIVFEIAADEDATEVISWAAARWREHRQDLRAATKSEAREWARHKL
jgi:hypothetical protein